ncbi:hypothetical protein GCM10025868_03920 [Angustibacter aerolatus]|uniref:Shikimate dehydrogenase substrate binding N-terminal domain-containing protein n=1 Tax=Angustibacter aerolatus TaxID=1162965 RepID=A0ABQ6JE10_9ACTN|nr:hypothetical protein GCM10025868_03920 [Angustibacter aerolatus]
MAPDATATEQAKMLVARTTKVLDDLDVPEDERQTLLTKASIVQAEGGSERDFGKIATVIERRLANDLQNGGKAQFDSTVAYGTGRGGVFTTAAERADTKNLYNTYARAGLPVGPIGNPGEAAIKAVLDPTPGPWTYFTVVNLDTGETKFTTSYQQHLGYVQQAARLDQGAPEQVRAAVLGSPVGHSLSPILHRAAYDALGLTGWRYEALEVADAAALHAFVTGLDDEWAGLSLTMPLKRLVQPLLDAVDEPARVTGSVNTVVLSPGRRTGSNTDVHGVVAALAEGGVTALAPGESVVLGGGATAASAVAALVGLGDRAPVLAVRDPARAGTAAAVAQALGGRARVVTSAEAPALLGTARVAVSTVPAAAAAATADLVRAAGPLGGVLLDVVYDPWPTTPAGAWQQAGARSSTASRCCCTRPAGRSRP